MIKLIKYYDINDSRLVVSKVSDNINYNPQDQNPIQMSGILSTGN